MVRRRRPYNQGNAAPPILSLPMVFAHSRSSVAVRLGLVASAVFALLMPVFPAASPMAPAPPPVSSGAPASAVSGPATTADDPDALYAQREDLASATRAARIWSDQLAARPRDFDVACKLARAWHWIGEVSKTDRASAFRHGMDAAKTAVAIDPRRPDGHFWLGVTTGALASVSNPLVALRYKSAIRKSFETSLALDPDYLYGGAHCALGKYYNAIPTWLGGDKQKSEQLLRRCLTYDPASLVGHYYLAQTLTAVDRLPEARAELRAVIAAPYHPSYVPEGKIWRGRAERMLRRLDAPRR